MVYDLSNLLPSTAIAFDTDEECVDIIRSVNQKETVEHLQPMFGRMHTERMWPYAISIDKLGESLTWSWCDVKWYAENGYTILHVSELNPVGSTAGSAGDLPDDFSMLDFELF